MAPALRILLVDDEPRIREEISTFLTARGHALQVAANGAEALALLDLHAFDVSLIDYRMPEMDGLTLAGLLRKRAPEQLIFVMTAYATVDSALQAMRSGVDDYLLKPLNPDHLEHKLALVAAKLSAERELAGLRTRVQTQSFPDLVGDSPAMRRVFTQLRIAAESELTVLLVGETGTGKEIAARGIHEASPRATSAFVAINCGAVADSLVESELFGHARGAFTGAHQARLGRLASADGGTLLLDELSSAPQSFQTRLLRVLEDRTFSPVGSDASRSVDVRIIAAMNTDPESDVHAGRLRRDLFYRLNVLRIDLPPLRERLEDIPLLVRYLLPRLPRRPRAPTPTVSSAFLQALMHRPWPGNVRELRHVLEASAAAASGGVLMPEHLAPGAGPPMVPAPELPSAPALEPPRPPGASEPGPALEPSGPLQPLDEFLAGHERAHLVRALTATGGNLTRAALLLGMDERSLRRRVARYGLDRRSFQVRGDFAGGSA